MRVGTSTVLASLSCVLLLHGCQKTTITRLNPELRDSAQNTRSTAGSRSLANDTSKDIESGNLETVDVNRDGKIDGWIYYDRSAGDDKLLQKRATDLNFDGRIDITQYFTKGKVSSEDFDLDYDGRIDMKTKFENGALTLIEIDTGFDGQFDVWQHYKNTRLTRRDRDTNRDGKIDEWQYFENDKISRIGRDTNFDGKIDTWE